MSSSQKTLKVLSVIMIVFAVISLISGFVFAGFILTNTTLSGEVAYEGNNMVVTYGMGSIVLGALFLVSGIVELAMGVFGLRGAKDPQKIGVFYVLAIIGVVYEAVSLIFGIVCFATGSMDAQTLASQAIALAFVAWCLWLAAKIKGSARA